MDFILWESSWWPCWVLAWRMIRGSSVPVLKTMLTFTPTFLLTPMVVAVVSHTAADAGYVVVIPLAGIIFYAAGRHPLAGIAAAFAGVSGGFTRISSPLDSIRYWRA